MATNPTVQTAQRKSTAQSGSQTAAQGVAQQPQSTVETSQPAVQQPQGSVQPSGRQTTQGTVQADQGAGNAVQPVQTEHTASYVDQNGEKQTGVYTATEQGTDYWENLRATYQKMYEDQVAANNKAAADAAAQAKENIEQQIDALNAEYSATNKQLYRDYKQQERILPQQMAAQGYGGGLAESSRLRLGTSYEEALRSNEMARLENVTQLNVTRAQAEYDAQAAAAQANAAAKNQLYQYELALQEAQRQEQQSQAETMAAVGDFSGYLDLGYSQAEVDYMTRLWLQENPGYLSNWVTAHPEEAARLGVQATATRRWLGINTNPTGDSEETPNPGITAGEAAAAGEQLLAEGTSVGDIYTQMQDLVASGQLSQESANSAMRHVRLTDMLQNAPKKENPENKPIYSYYDPDTIAAMRSTEYSAN